MEIYSLFSSFLSGASVGFLASIPLGPIGILCIQRTLSKGRQSGFASGAGAATSDLVYAVVACFSVSIVTDFVEAHKDLLFVLGMLVLAGLGLKMILSDPIRQIRKRNRSPRSTSLWQDFVSTLFLTLPNPLVLFVFITMFSLIGGEFTFSQQILIVLGVLTGALTWWLVLTLLVGLFRKKITIRRLCYLNRLAGAIILVLVIVAAINEFASVLA